MIIPRGTFREMNDDVFVEALYPNIQVDMFPYKNPLSYSKDFDSIGYIASTTFNGQVFYEYYSSPNYWYVKDDEIIENLKNNVKQLVLKSL